MQESPVHESSTSFSKGPAWTYVHMKESLQRVQLGGRTRVTPAVTGGA
jgi:hypothetical protein